MRTQDLILDLAARGKPVRPLPTPLKRTALWLLASIPLMTLVAFVLGLRDDPIQHFMASRWLLEQMAALATAACAAYAAFALSVPGRSRQWALLPLGTGVLWGSVLGAGCLVDWRVAGADAFQLAPEPECFVLISLVGVGPAIVIVKMVKAGAPLFPARILSCAALAAAALGAFGLRLVHDQDLGLMVLVWQFTSVVVIAGLGWLAGPRILKWHQMKRSTG